MRKKALMAAPNYYTSVYQVGSHHYARAFERLGYDVAYLSDPISWMHGLVVADAAYRERKAIHGAGGKTDGHIRYYVPTTWLPPQNKPLLSSAWVLQHWHRCAPGMMRRLRQEGFGEVDVLWIDSPLFHFLLDAVKYTTAILRIADVSRGLGVSEAHHAMETRISARVDRVVMTSRQLRTHYPDIEDAKIRYVANGIDLARFDACDHTPPAEYARIPHPRAIYVGMMARWFDVDVLARAAERCPAMQFVLIGGVHTDVSRLQAHPNIHLLGTRPYERICCYLRHADIGIIPFIRSDLVDAVSPLKLYEYLACGLRVVSTKWAAIADLEAYCDLAEDGDAFVDFLQHPSSRNPRAARALLERSGWTAKLASILEEHRA